MLAPAMLLVQPERSVRARVVVARRAIGMIDLNIALFFFFFFFLRRGISYGTARLVLTSVMINERQMRYYSESAKENKRGYFRD
jgi:hypothetical protein